MAGSDDLRDLPEQARDWLIEPSRPCPSITQTGLNGRELLERRQAWRHAERIIIDGDDVVVAGGYCFRVAVVVPAETPKGEEYLRVARDDQEGDVIVAVICGGEIASAIYDGTSLILSLVFNAESEAIAAAQIVDDVALWHKEQAEEQQADYYGVEQFARAMAVKNDRADLVRVLAGSQILGAWGNRRDKHGVIHINADFGGEYPPRDYWLLFRVRNGMLWLDTVGGNYHPNVGGCWGSVCTGNITEEIAQEGVSAASMMQVWIEWLNHPGMNNPYHVARDSFLEYGIV